MAITLRTGSPVRGVEAIAEKPDGTRFPFVPYPTPLRDASGKLVGAVNMLVDITDRKRIEEDAQLLASIVESSDDAIVSKNLTGAIVSWNKGAERLFGYEAHEVIGKPITVLIPPDRLDEETHILELLRHGERIDHFETVRRRKDGSLFEISITVSPVRNAKGVVIGASKIARDISERKRAEELLRQQRHRFETLDRISKTISGDLDLERVVQAVTDIATALSGAQVGAYFNRAAESSGERYAFQALCGAPRHTFEEFGLGPNSALLGPTFEGAEIVRSDDILADLRYSEHLLHHGVPKGDARLASYLAVPVVARSGEVVGGLMLGHARQGVFSEETEELVAGIAAHAAIAVDNARLHQAAQVEIERRRRAEETKALLLNEIEHRVKNTLAIIQAIASQTFPEASSEQREAFSGRLRALANAHGLLTHQSWDRAAISDVVRSALAPFQERNKERIDVAGPEVHLNAAKAVLVAMALHELATNAIKYGALSDEAGRVSIGWKLAGTSRPSQLCLRWCETGGPRVAQPRRKGFGTRLIQHSLSGDEGAAHFEFAPQGLICTLELSL
jgi:PAS domain S-box-containing protein